MYKSKIQDGFNLLSKLSTRKIKNACQVLKSYHNSRFTGKPNMRGLPFSLSIEPTTSCNLRCPECPSGLRSFTRPTGMLTTSLFTRLIDELQESLIYLLLYFQGEPYLNPDFLYLVSYASKKGIYTSTSTNAHYLTPQKAEETVRAGLDRIIISIDGASQATYEQYRIGGKLSKVIEGTKNLMAAKKKLQSRTPYVIFQFLVVRPNERDIPNIKVLAHDLGVDELKLKTAQIYDYQRESNLIPQSGKYSRYYQQADKTWAIKNPLNNHCWKMWHSCVVTWDGNIVPCCFDKDARHQLGNLSNQTFEQIWNSPPYFNFRSNLLTSRKTIDICKNCTEGTKVWA